MSASTLQTLNQFAQTNVAFQQQVVQAALTAAAAVAAESPGTKSANQIAKRSALATKVLNNPGSVAVAFAQAVLTNTTIAAEVAGNQTIPDGDVQFAVNSLWNALAGVTSTENTG